MNGHFNSLNSHMRWNSKSASNKYQYNNDLVMLNIQISIFRTTSPEIVSTYQKDLTGLKIYNINVFI